MNNNHKRFLLIIISLLPLAFFGCQQEIEVELPDYETKIVIEGSIETGEPAMVILSKSIPYFAEINLDYLMNHVFIQDAEVYINTSDGQSERLMFQYCADSPIFFAYRGNNILGRENTSYTLTVNYDGDEALLLRARGDRAL